MAFSWWLQPADPEPIYRRTKDETLLDPDRADPALAMLPVEYAGHVDWPVTAPLERIDGWCEDRDPNADWELTDEDGRE